MQLLISQLLGVLHKPHIIPDPFPPGESGLATRDYIWPGLPVNSRKWQYMAEVHRCSFCGLGLLKVEWLAEVLDATSGC